MAGDGGSGGEPDRWQRVRALFAEVVEQAPERRDELLAGEADPEIRDEVASLLANLGGARSRLRGAVASEVAELAHERAASLVGRRLGPYRLIEPIGEGGMGAVYLAERDDGQYRRTVAIKVLHHGLGSPQAIARFRDERQILAALAHPGIVRLLDGGTTEEGLPYLVMERVEGVPITGHARACGLSIRGRVELVRRVCGAVQYAHGRLVIHRDLKPDNILVGADGTPALLDFGIAKLLDPAADREAKTRTGMALLTPEYASPEQVRGEPVSVATDVYALGAVLYELLAGRPPQQPAGNALEMLRVICELDPPRPSAIATAAARREIAGDLDNIVLKALHKDPARRYASMEQLADDLGRHLDGLPVAAREGTLRYRAGKLVRRHRGKLAFAALVAVALGVATVVSIVQARRARAHADLAELRTRNLLIEQGLEELRAGRASRALPYLAEVLRQGEDTPALRFLIAEASRPLERQIGEAFVAREGLSRAVWSPDGSTIALAGYGGLRLLDRDLRVRTILDPSGPYPAFTPDGTKLVSVGSAMTVWDAATGVPLRRSVGDVHTELASLTVDDRHVVAIDVARGGTAWDIETGAVLLRFAPGTPATTAAVVTPDGRYVLCGLDDGSLVRREAGTGAIDLRRQAHEGPVRVLRMTRDGRLFSGGEDGMVRTWNGATLAPIATLAGHSTAVHAIELDLAQATVATVSRDRSVRVWDASTGRLLSVPVEQRIRTSGGHPFGAELSADGTRLVATLGDNAFRVWDASTGELEMLIESFATSGDAPGSVGGALEARFSPDGTRLLALSGTELKLWRVDREPLASELTTPYRLYAARWSPDEREIAAIGFGAAIFDAATGARRVELDLGAKRAGAEFDGLRLFDVDWSPDGRHLVVVGEGGTAVVFSTSGARERTLAGHRGTVNGALYSPDGTRLVTAGDDGMARIWDPSSGEVVRTLGHPHRVLAATWSVDGARIATAGWDRTLRVWDVASGRLVREIGGGTTQFLFSALAPDGKTLASTGHDGEVTLWRVDTGERALSLEGHTGPATMVAWSPDGELLATSADDGSARIWDPRTGRMLAVLPHPDAVMQLGWSRDGERLLTVSHERSVRTWAIRRDRRPVAEVLDFAGARSPWRLVESRLIRAR